MLFAATCIGIHISHMDADYISNSKRCFFCFAFGPGFVLYMFIFFHGFCRKSPTKQQEGSNSKKVQHKVYWHASYIQQVNQK